MVKYLSRKLIPLSTGIALLIAVLAPVTFWIYAHLHLQQMISLYAEDLASQLREVAQESPSLWKYQSYKFIAIAEGFHPTIELSGFRVLDEKGKLITGHDYHQHSWPAPGQKLTFMEDFHVTLGSAPIIFNDRQVGSVEVLANDAPIVRTGALLICFSSLAGIALAVLIYRFPVRVVRKMAGEIEELIAELRLSEGNYQSLNRALELKVEERTTDLLEAQEELVRKEKLAILGQLSGCVGHELRNPLGVMSNAIYFLKMVNADADETTREYLDIIKYEIDNSQRIITDLLDFARTRTPRTKAVSIGELAAESIKKCIIAENINFQSDIQDNLPLLRVDPLQMEQVLQNLISNAVQAMPDGGSLIFSARKVQGARHEDRGDEEIIIEPQTPSPDPDFIEISVSDTGEGIAPENMKKLFQPLFTTKAKGIGLGLVVCRNLVEANGGRIEVKSQSGKGTTFTVILPVREEW